MMKQKILRRTLAGALTAATLLGPWRRARGERELYRGMGRHARAAAARAAALGHRRLVRDGRSAARNARGAGAVAAATRGTQAGRGSAGRAGHGRNRARAGAGRAPPLPPLTVETGDLAFLDNGVPAQTASAASGNYAMVGSVPIKNASRQTLDTAALADGSFSAALSEQAPQVLIVHTHGSEAYTMPAGEEYAATGSFRTDDATRSVVRVATRSRRCSRRTASPSSRPDAARQPELQRRVRAVSPRSRGIWRSIRR